MVLQIHTREEWGAVAPFSPPQKKPLQRGIIVHWNGPPMGAYAPHEVPGIIWNTQNFHMKTRGWNDIAYNHSADRFGRIWEGRGLDVVNAASGDTFANYNLHALECLCGEGEPFTVTMKDGIVDYCRFQWDRGVDHTLYVHNDVTQTECPGSEISLWVHTELPAILAGSNHPIPPVVDIDEEIMIQAYRKPNDTTVYLRNDATGKEISLNDTITDSHDHMAVLNRLVELKQVRPLFILQDNPTDWDVNYALAVIDGRAGPV